MKKRLEENIQGPPTKRPTIEEKYTFKYKRNLNEILDLWTI